jgi:hypothetical protein
MQTPELPIIRSRSEELQLSPEQGELRMQLPINVSNPVGLETMSLLTLMPLLEAAGVDEGYGGSFLL